MSSIIILPSVTIPHLYYPFVLLQYENKSSYLCLILSCHTIVPLSLLSLLFVVHWWIALYCVLLAWLVLGYDW